MFNRLLSNNKVSDKLQVRLLMKRLRTSMHDLLARYQIKVLKTYLFVIRATSWSLLNSTPKNKTKKTTSSTWKTTTTTSNLFLIALWMNLKKKILTTYLIQVLCQTTTCSNLVTNQLLVLIGVTFSNPLPLTA